MRSTIYRVYNEKAKKYLSGNASKTCWQNPGDALTKLKANPGSVIHSFDLNDGNSIYNLKQFEAYCVLTSKTSRLKANNQYRRWRTDMHNEMASKFCAIVGLNITSRTEVQAFLMKAVGPTADKVLLDVQPIVDEIDNMDFDTYVLTKFKH